MSQNETDFSGQSRTQSAMLENIMVIKCPIPRCPGEALLGNDYQRLLERAEAGTLHCMCGTCRHGWIAADQEALAKNLRNLVAKVSA